MFRFKVNVSMLRQCVRQLPQSIQMRSFRVTVVGASGGIGQPLSLLLKTNDLISELVLQDIVDSRGVATDLSHISTPCQIKHTLGKTELDKAIKGSDVVVVVAGMPRKPNMERDHLFDVNADVVIEVATSVAKNSPHALLAVVTNPVNALLPMAAEILKQNDAYDPNRLFGVTTLDVVRAEQFVADHMNLNPKKVRIPVIGGHTGLTIMPIFSQCKPAFRGDDECIAALTNRIQLGGDEVVQAKAGKGSATLSTAFACFRFVNAMLMGLKGIEGPPECAYVESNVTDAAFFATPLTFGPRGIEKNHGLPAMNDIEKQALEKSIGILKVSIEKGIKYVKK
ncbi:malate dehydrogenase, mitochondrial-like [Drosophila tropicalis]|uniref:malate dehydrogenase, mitochondrial-like n=1 Tax=Drosophila tropicalis TaxID=46794 RepID=UPI0035AB7953